MSQFSTERTVAIEAVQMAARACRSIKINLAPDDTILKKDLSPVTVADFCSQAIIHYYLKQAFPNDALAAEEDATDLLKPGQKATRLQVCKWVRSVIPDLSNDRILHLIDSGKHQGGKESRFWTLDPIDGTKGFIRNQQYAISLGLIQNGEPAFGILGCPNYPSDWSNENADPGRLFYAERGGGAFQRRLNDSREEPIHVSDIAEPNQAILCESFESGHSAHDVSREIAKQLEIANPPLRIDSQCKYAAIACGDATIYLRLPTRPDYQEKIWDHAAGSLILMEAGGRVTDICGEPLDFSLGRTLSQNQGIVATNGLIHDRVLKVVEDCCIQHKIIEIRHHFRTNP
jgi:3'(2'), 5'-bisphosphate nucleotidase